MIMNLLMNSCKRGPSVSHTIIFGVTCTLLFVGIPSLKGEAIKAPDKTQPAGEVLDIYPAWNKLSLAIAAREHGKVHAGGKEDDITIIVVQVL
ncbi:hypothetical protein [Cardinium endosymbiont of Tipula unca]|uniref:hypothetical protein n=1 Tax=Cardinium endosymbiont of Tipula unca TaxID=3066216 RepID=UPI0030CAF865